MTLKFWIQSSFGSRFSSINLILLKKDRFALLFTLSLTLLFRGTSWRGRLDPWEGGSPNGTPLGDGIFPYDKKFTKNSDYLCEFWSWVWFYENRPTYGDFETGLVTPQIHQNLKPIRLLTCTYLYDVTSIYKHHL